MSDRCHMHTNLMCATGFQLKGHVGISMIPVQHRVVRDCFASAFGDRHFLAVGFVARNWFVNCAAVCAWATHHNRLITAKRSVRSYLRSKALVRGIIFRHDKQTARVLVDAMHDARPMLTVDAGQTIATMIHQRINQCARPVTWCGMNHHTAWLVDHNQVSVLIDYIKRYVFRRQIDLTQLGQGDSDAFAANELVILFQRFTRTTHRLFGQEILYRGAG